MAVVNRRGGALRGLWHHIMLLRLSNTISPTRGAESHFSSGATAA
jgi:hypothetical protein